MDNVKDDLYYVRKILGDPAFIIVHDYGNAKRIVLRAV